MRTIVKPIVGSSTWQNGVLFGFRRCVPTGHPARQRTGSRVDVFVHANMLISVRETDTRALLLTGRCGVEGVVWDQEATRDVPVTAMVMLADDVSDLVYAFHRASWLTGTPAALDIQQPKPLTPA